MMPGAPFTDPRYLKALRGLEEAVALQRIGRLAGADSPWIDLCRAGG
jgi:hypothetical protein